MTQTTEQRERHTDVAAWKGCREIPRLQQRTYRQHIPRELRFLGPIAHPTTG